jgi:DNA-directed RNA polymerase subunit RPC12/RpoP
MMKRANESQIKNMMDSDNLKCPQCSGIHLDCRELGISGSRWKIMFGREIFKKEELLAYACEDCGFVFLQLKNKAAK